MQEVQYTVGQLASLSGTTIRTIQYYDKIGLLVAGRSGDKNSRLYGERDLVRLQQILFYKQMGMSLKEIRQHGLGTGEPQDVRSILKRQYELLFRKEMELKTSRAVLGAILSTLDKDPDYNLEAVMKLALGLNKNTLVAYLNLEYDDEIKAAAAENDWDEDKPVEIYLRWKRLVFEAVTLKNNETRPESDAGYGLGEKWHAFVRFATDDREEMTEAYSRTYERREQWPEEDRLLMEYADDYIDRAYAYYLSRLHHTDYSGKEEQP